MRPIRIAYGLIGGFLLWSACCDKESTPEASGKVKQIAEVQGRLVFPSA